MACEKEVADTTAFVIRESDNRRSAAPSSACTKPSITKRYRTPDTTGSVAKLAAMVGYAESGERKVLLKMHSEIVTGEDELGIKRKLHMRARESY